MEPDTRHPDISTRLRLVDLVVTADRGPLQLGGAFTGVLTGPDNRTAAARFIATALAGPRPPDIEGTVDIDGTRVAISTLPSPLLPPNVPSVIGRDVVQAQWQAACGLRRDELAAMHASTRLEGHRIDAALERARARVVTAAEVEGPPAATPVAPEPEIVPADPSDEEAARRQHLRSLLAALDLMQPEPLPEGVLLADAWDAQAALIRARDAADTLHAADLEALEHRVNVARVAVAMTEGVVPDDVREHIELCHRAVVAAEAAAFEARRRERAKTIARYEEAVTAELLALADAGIESYAAFLVAIDEQGPAVDAAGRLAAQAELTAARAALDDALQVPDVPTREELEERQANMRARAAELLGDAPGIDPATALRLLRVEPQGRTDALAEIAEVLRTGGVDVTDDVVANARAYLDPVAEPTYVEQPRAGTASIGNAAAAHTADVVALDRQRIAQHRALAAIENDLARLDEALVADVMKLGTAELMVVFESLLEAYRGGYLLGGRLPIVLDGVLDGLPAGTREAVVRLLAAADDAQTIVVSDDPEVMQSVATAGGTLVRWPAAAPSPATGAPSAGPDPRTPMTDSDQPDRLQTSPTRGA